MHKKKKTVLLTAAVLLLFLIGWVIWGNTALELNTYTVTSAHLPKAFEGFRIAHVSDLHNAEMGKENEALLAMLKEAKPDLIAITGDLIDSRHTDLAVALRFVEEAMRIAPCYYVTGNHEARISEYAALKKGLLACGVIVLEDERAVIERGAETITVLGAQDPTFYGGASRSKMRQILQTLTKDADDYTILLSHRPELFDVYAESDVDLVFSGHAHGGQFRIPFIGGLYSPGEGWFPQYDTGLYTENGTTMAVSRGIGNSLFPFRINNRPEVILIELSGE